MKALFVLVALVAVYAHAAAVDKQPDEEQMKKDALEVRGKCLADLKGTEADLKEIEEKHDVSSDFAKKMTLCVFKAYKIIDENNKYSKANIIDVAKKVLQGKPNAEDKVKVAEEIAEACDKEVGALQAGAPEETAKAVYDCLKKNVVERKLAEIWKV